MEDANLDHVVSFVKTYTSDWRSKRSTEKKKGITRITKMSKEKYEEPPTIPFGNTDQNFNNSNYRFVSERKEKIVFHEEMGRAQIQRQQTQKRIINKEAAQLVQSHYINCQQDVEQLIRLKQKLEERINNLEIENNFLKINMGIQEQYIIKIQTEVDALRLKYQLSTISVQTQTYQEQNVSISIHNLKDGQIQCDLQQNEFQNFQKFSKEVEQQTTEFYNLINKLQNEKQMLSIQNKTLLSKIQSIQQKLEQQHNNRENIKNNLTKEIQNLIETEYNLKMSLKNFEQSKQKMVNQINEQNKLYQKEKQLRMQIEKQKEATLKAQLQKIAQIQSKYHQYKKQLDYLLSFLQQKNDMLTQRNHRIYKKQHQNGFYSDRLANKEHQQSLRKDQTNDYEDRVSRIKMTMQNYLEQLAQYRDQQESKYKQSRINKKEDGSKENQNNWGQKQREIGQDIGYLLNKITSLEQLIDEYKKEKAERQKQIDDRQNLLQIQFRKITKLEQQNQITKGQLQDSKNEVRYIQHLIKTLKDQKTQIQNSQYYLRNQNQNIKSQLIMINQQLQLIKEKCNDDKISVFMLREESQKQKNSIQELVNLLKNNQERLKRQLIMNEQQRNRFYLEKEQLIRQLDSLKIQSQKYNSTIQDLRIELFEMSHKYEQMAKNHAYAKRENVKLVQQNIQLKQKNEITQRQIELIAKSHRESLKEMEDHIIKLQANIQRQRQLGIAEKKQWQKQKELVKKDYDILYNKYLKYKNIALHLQPNQH